MRCRWRLESEHDVIHGNKVKDGGQPEHKAKVVMGDHYQKYTSEHRC